jgi:transmembrane sensor
VKGPRATNKRFFSAAVAEVAKPAVLQLGMERKRRLPTGATGPAPRLFELRDVRTDDPTLVELDSAGARSTMTRANDVEQRACEWMIRSEGGDFTEVQRAEMQRWLKEPRNRITFLRINEAWRRASRLRGARPLDGNVDPDLLKNTDLSLRLPSDTNKSGWPMRVAAAAALSLIIYLACLAAWIASRPSDWMRYTTSIGGYSNIALADGTGIQLNTDSEVRARLTAHSREIQLVRGEALFAVSADRHRPLRIEAANVAVRVNQLDETTAGLVVRLRAGGAVDVSVTRGSVVLEPAERLFDIAFRRPSVQTSTIVEGDTAAIRPEGVRLIRVGLEELNRKLSWTAGLLSFQGETLAEVTDEFNRYNRKQLIVTDPAIASRRIGGAFQATDPDSFVSALRKGFGVRSYEQPQENSDAQVIRLTSAR